MRNEFEGWVFYESSFNPDTGMLVRDCEIVTGFGDLVSQHPRFRQEPQYPVQGPKYVKNGDPGYDAYQGQSTQWYADQEDWRRENPSMSDRWREKFGWRRLAFSPVPETLDVKITNQCGFGCHYCYMDSVPHQPHAKLDLVEAIFDGLDQAPYQIAIGGGEPTGHPQLPEFLRFIREKGTVPNLTTAGFYRPKSVTDAINDFCGGIAVTYHPHRGIKWFTETFLVWKKALSPRVQINVHVMAGKGGAKHLCDLVDAFQEHPELAVSDLNLVLLAFYPEVGRSALDGLMPRGEFMVTFPQAIIRAKKMGASVAFSEGLLPFFLSRPELGVDTTFSTPQEGVFSCYVDDKGRISHSSFAPPEDAQTHTDEEGSTWTSNGSANIFQTRFQDIWFSDSFLGPDPGLNGTPCYKCQHEKAGRCAAPHWSHLFMCAYQGLNKGEPAPPTPEEQQEATRMALWSTVCEELGPNPNDGEFHNRVMAEVRKRTKEQGL